MQKKFEDMQTDTRHAEVEMKHAQDQMKKVGVRVRVRLRAWPTPGEGDEDGMCIVCSHAQTGYLYGAHPSLAALNLARSYFQSTTCPYPNRNPNRSQLLPIYNMPFKNVQESDPNPHRRRWHWR